MNESDYNRWKKYVNVIFTTSSNEDKDEILHIFLEKFITINISGINNLENYIFIMIRNTGLRYLKKKSSISFERVEVEEFEDFGFDYDYEADSNLEVEIVNKLSSINDILIILNNSDKELYKLHFIRGLKQREIARLADIPISRIHKRIQYIKNKIKDNYGKKV